MLCATFLGCFVLGFFLYNNVTAAAAPTGDWYGFDYASRTRTVLSVRRLKHEKQLYFEG